MNPNNLIIEDFDFQQYPVVRVYPLGGKTVVQISEPTSEKNRNQLHDEIETLEEQNSSLEEEIKDLEGENEDLKKDKDKLDEQLDSAFSALDSHEVGELGLQYNVDYKASLNENLWKLINLLQEEIGSLRIDNRALASTINEQDKTIADLTEKLLAAQEN